MFRDPFFNVSVLPLTFTLISAAQHLMGWLRALKHHINSVGIHPALDSTGFTRCAFR